MPTYEYACKDCGKQLEVVQSFSDDPLTECPECGGRLRKIFGNVGISFKGSGFYKTDSRPSGANAKKAPEATPSAESNSPTEPAAKPEAAKPAPAGPAPGKSDKAAG
jgi:putative FmdB family regulatory protein